MAADGVTTYEKEFEIKCSAEKFFNIFADHVTLLPQILPHMFKSTTVVKGDGKSVGSVVDWEYYLEPPAFESARQTIEAIDEENMLLTIRFYGGCLGKKFHLYRARFEAFKKGNKNYAKWSVDVERTHDEIPEAHDYMEFAQKFTKELDSRLSNTDVAV